jgi:hypothetical protein
VSTRKLIVLALVCGLAILGAGGVQLFRIAGTDERTVEVLSEGEAAAVGSVTVTVENSQHDGAVIRATVRMSAPEETTVLLASFTLLAGGRLHPALDTDGADSCPSPVAVGSAPTTCSVAFEGDEGTATLAFSRDDEQAQWRLEP